MGLSKQLWMEEIDRGWSDKETFICEQCVEDDYLQSAIANAVVCDTCSYCGRSEPHDIAAPFAVVMEPIASTVYYYFGDPTAAGVPWDGGPIIDPVDTRELLETLPLRCNDNLLEDVADALHNDDWVECAGGHWASLHESEALSYSWRTFVRLVKYETRFHFHARSSPVCAEPQEVAPGNLLSVLGNLVATAGLVRPFPAGTLFYRARLRTGDEWAADAVQLGAPPPDKARAGRMNPSGIAYLYTALEVETAIAETVQTPPIEAVVATFGAARTLMIIDLCSLPVSPSIFDENQRDQRESLLFLQAFVREISQPVRKDGSEHIDYVPSQVVSEYFAQAFQNVEGGIHIDGILYPSSILPGGRNVVLFPTERGWNRKFDSVEFKDVQMKQLDDWMDVMSAIGRPSSWRLGATDGKGA